MLKKYLAPLVACFFVAGCATIVGNPVQVVPVDSSPDGAAVAIVDETGKTVFRGETPTTVTLQKSDGSYWGGKDYTVTISKSGYQEQSIPIASSPNGWYIAGNILLGGLIGWFIVDPLNGAMYTLTPAEVDASLSGGSSHNNRNTDGSISIVLLEDVPESLRAKMKRIK